MSKKINAARRNYYPGLLAVAAATGTDPGQFFFLFSAVLVRQLPFWLKPVVILAQARCHFGSSVRYHCLPAVAAATGANYREISSGLLAVLVR